MKKKMNAYLVDEYIFFDYSLENAVIALYAAVEEAKMTPTKLQRFKDKLTNMIEIPLSRPCIFNDKLTTVGKIMTHFNEPCCAEADLSLHNPKYIKKIVNRTNPKLNKKYMQLRENVIFAS